MRLPVSKAILFSLCLGISGTLVAISSARAESGELKNFITRRGDQFMDGDQPYRFISFNIPNLLVVEDAYSFTNPNPWRWPEEFEIEDALESVRQMGGQVVRTYVLSVRREGSDMGDLVHVRGPGEFNEEGFRALDKVMEVARRKGIRVIIPFVDNAKWWGGVAEYAAFRGKPKDAFWSDPQIIEDFKATVRHLITRKNTYNGVVYRDDPTIFAWETGNEIDSTPEWTREIAAYIKELDPNHLVIDGRSLHGVPLTSLEDPNVDVITTHHYPWEGNQDFVKPIRAAHTLTKGKKPYFVGEFGFVKTPNLAVAVDAVVEDGISGALLWSLRPHRPEGGFYWHMEVGTGGNFYKAFHWPGFASGNAYGERQVMQMMREKAYEIRGLTPPPLEAPAAPKLLPIERVSAISWQGSAGASSYDVLRATNPTGPWQTIAQGVSDADVQYRPLFDDQADPGQSYCYRVVARNSAGESPPSNVVGPVAVDRRTMVDECRDLTSTTATQGKVTVADENARQVQEDSHRFAMPVGSSVTYRVGGPINGVRVYLFARDDTVRPTVAISADGEKFTPVELKRQAFDAGKTVYGYLTPILVEGSVTKPDGTYLRISVPESSPAGGQKAKGTEAATAAQAPVEISRVEIDYDRLK